MSKPRTHAELEHADKLAVIAIMERLTDASPDDIRKELAERWAELDEDWMSERGRVRLQALLKRMVKSHHLKRTGYGRYALTVNYATRCFDRFDTLERRIATLFAREGSASKRDILIDTGNSPREHATDAHKMVEKVLRESELFEHPDRSIWRLKRGVVGLPFHPFV